MMFKHTLIKTAVMSAALALTPVALMGEDNTRSSSSQSQAGQAGAAGQSSASDRSGQSSASSTGARSGSRSDRSSGGILSQGAFNEQKFVQKAMEGNQFEIQLAQLAQQKAESQEVKQLAQTIIQDHQQANQMLMQAAGGQSGQSGASARQGQPGQSNAQASGSSSSGDQQLGAVCQAKLAEFQQLQGAEFDQAYVMDQLADHVKAVLKYRTASMKAQNPQIKQYATQTLPKLQGHLQQIQQLAGWDEATTAGATIHGDHSGSSATDRQPGASTGGDRSGGSTSSDRSTGAGSSSTGGSSSSGDRSSGQQNR